MARKQQFTRRSTRSTRSAQAGQQNEAVMVASSSTVVPCEPSRTNSPSGSTSKSDLVKCGACFDWFRPCTTIKFDQQRKEAIVEADSLPSNKTIASISPDSANHERLSLLGGVGFVFQSCHKKLCSGCLHSYLLTRLSEARTGLSLVPLSCAECRQQTEKPDCIAQNQVHFILSDAEWDEYQRLLILGSFKNKFYCPNTTCLAVFDAEDVQRSSAGEQQTTQVACPECKKTACVKCGCAWHVGFTCESYKNRPLFIRDAEDELAINLAKQKNWSQCPKTECRHFIELETGCNHITCICGTEFCYLCLADWKVERDERGLVQAQYCSRKDRGGPACPLYTEDTLQGGVQQRGFRQRRHAMDWIVKDRFVLPFQKSNTFTRHLLASRRCGYCNASCKTMKNLVSHLEWSGHDVFDCCAKFFKTRIDFDCHVKNAHPGRQWVAAEVVLRHR